jgi:hypothetical protein
VCRRGAGVTPPATGYRVNAVVSLGRQSVALAGQVEPTSSATHRCRTLIRRRPGFPPPSLRLTLGRVGRGRTGGDAEGRRRLSAGRLCTSQAMIGTGSGWDGTRGEPALRPVKSPALPTQVRILSLPQPSEQRKRRHWPSDQAGFDAPVSLRFPSTRHPADTARPSRAAGPNTPSISPATRGAVWGSWWM